MRTAAQLKGREGNGDPERTVPPFTGRLINFDLGFVLMDWTNCDHRFWVPAGYQESGSPRYLCRVCGQWITDSPRDARLVRLARLGRLFVSGASIAEAMGETGYTFDTVRDYYEAISQFSGRPIPTKHNARKTHCPAGHEYTPENTWSSGGKRRCKACQRARRPQ